MMVGRPDVFLSAFVVALGSLCLGAVLEPAAVPWSGQAVAFVTQFRAAPPASGPAVVLSLGERANVVELIGLLRRDGRIDLITAARAIAQAAAARERGEPPVARILMPSDEAAAAFAAAVPRLNIAAQVVPARSD
jgi:hypothetical protein